MALSASGSVPGHEHAVFPNLKQRQEAQVGNTEDPAETTQQHIRLLREAVQEIDELLVQIGRYTPTEPAVEK